MDAIARQLPDSLEEVLAPVVNEGCAQASDPLTDISSVRNSDTVIVGGKVVVGRHPHRLNKLTLSFQICKKNRSPGCLARAFGAYLCCQSA